MPPKQAPPSNTDDTTKANKHTKENTPSGEAADRDGVEEFFNEVSIATYESLPRLGPPSEDEQLNFYYGITSRPRLVGRASSTTKPWVSLQEQKVQWSQEAMPPPWLSYTKKRLSNIGVHPIRTYWEKVEPFITMAVSRLPWTSIDILRMVEFEERNHGEKITDNPVVVWIGIKHHDIAYGLVAEALRACRFALDAENLFDVDVQIRVSNVFTLSPPTENRTPSSRAVDNSPGLHACRLTMGASMFPLKCPYINGTMGLFVSPATAVDDETEHMPVWALTCRHVGLPIGCAPANTVCSAQESAGNDRHLICLPSDEYIDGALFLLENEKMVCEKTALQSGHEEDKVALEKAIANLAAAKAFEHREARISGSVLFAPQISKQQTDHDSPTTWFRDYCVLEIRRDNFPELESFQNTLELAPVLDNDLLFAARLLRAQQLNQNGFQFPRDGVVRVKGTIPVCEMRQPLGDSENLMHDTCIIVVKRGSASGITFGCPSELMSTVRGDDGVNTLEWAIVGSFGSKSTPFSKRGDSGAAVVGLDGRLGGFLTRGVGLEDGFSVDITYVTPAEFVFADIEREIGRKIVIR